MRIFEKKNPKLIILRICMHLFSEIVHFYSTGVWFFFKVFDILLKLLLM